MLVLVISRFQIILFFFFISLLCTPCSALLTLRHRRNAVSWVVANLFGAVRHFGMPLGVWVLPCGYIPGASLPLEQSLERVSRQNFGRVEIFAFRVSCAVCGGKGKKVSKYGMTFVTVCDGGGANGTLCHCSCQLTWDGNGNTKLHQSVIVQAVDAPHLFRYRSWNSDASVCEVHCGVASFIPVRSGGFCEGCRLLVHR